MKRIILVIFMAILSLTLCAENQSSASGDAARLVSLINQYNGHEGFEVVKLGSMATSMVKLFIRKSLDSADPDERAALELIRGIRKVAVVEYDDCSSDTKSGFVSRVERLLSEENLLMSANDGGEAVKLYGFVSEDGGQVRDFILHAPASGALVCLFGTISIDSIAAMMTD